MNVLEGRVAVVAGGSRGVGAAAGEALEREGVRVATISRSGTGAGLAIRGDVANLDEVMAVRERVQAELGTPTILVNAAALAGPLKLIKDVDPEVWVRTLMIDLVGSFFTCRLFLNGMLEEGWGRIINVSSAGALHTPGTLGSAYGTSKAGMNRFTRHLAAEIEGTGVTANVIHPGDIKTEMWADIRDQLLELGPAGESQLEWVRWVEETGGDPVAKSADLIVRIAKGDMNGEFLWIEDPLQKPIPSWETSARAKKPGE